MNERSFIMTLDSCQPAIASRGGSLASTGNCTPQPFVLLNIRRNSLPMLAAMAVFLCASIFRSLDHAICDAFPLGTHFMWASAQRDRAIHADPSVRAVWFGRSEAVGNAPGGLTRQGALSSLYRFREYRSLASVSESAAAGCPCIPSARPQRGSCAFSAAVLSQDAIVFW
jgi:hypothetical protein